VGIVWSADHDGAGCGRIAGHDGAGIERLADHDAAGCGRGSMRGAAGGGRIADHDAAGNGRIAAHDAAGIGRLVDHDAPGGSRPTPREPPHGSINLWVFERLWGSMGDDRGVAPPRPRHHPDDATSMAKPHKRPLPGIAGVRPWPTHAPRIDPRTIPAARWIIDPTIPAASWSASRPHPGVSIRGAG
jgi:hypothetical protein